MSKSPRYGTSSLTVLGIVPPVWGGENPSQ